MPYEPFVPTMPGPEVDPSINGQMPAPMPGMDQLVALMQQMTMQQASSLAPEHVIERRNVEPLPPDRLCRMFLAWDQAKRDELQEQHTARRYYHGKQWTEAEKKRLQRRRQPIITSNRIKRKVDFLVGVEQRLRRDVKAYARNLGQEQSAWVATAGLRYVQDANKWPDLASDCANDAFVCGTAAIRNHIRARKGKPEIVKMRVPSDRWFYDPRSEKWDFSDARYLGTHQWMDVDEAIEMIPQGERAIRMLATSGSGGTGGAFAPLFNPSLQAKEKTWVDTERQRLYVIEIFYRHEGEWLFDYLCGSFSLIGRREDTRSLDEPPFDFDFVSPYLDDEDKSMHPYTAFSAYVDEAGDRYGVVRDMFSPQDEINKRKSKLLHQLSVRQTKGVKGSVDDIEAMKREMAKPDGHVEFNPGNLGTDAFGIIDQSDQVRGQVELLQEAKAEIENLGPNPGLIGRGVEQQSGRAILAQQNSGMTELSPVFERTRSWKLDSFRKDWCMVRQFYTGERWIRITGDAGAPQYIGLNVVQRDPMGNLAGIQNYVPELDVDVLLDEGPDTIVLQEELLEQLSKFGPDIVPPEVLIQLSNIKDKDKVMKMLEEAKAPPQNLVQLQELMGKLEALLKAAEVDKARAEVENKRADALSKYAATGIAFDQIPMANTAFPSQWRSPSEFENVQAALGTTQQVNAMLGEQQEGQGQMGAGGSPVGPMGNEAPMVPGQEPQLGAEGGLPLGGNTATPAGGAVEPKVPLQ